MLVRSPFSFASLVVEQKDEKHFPFVIFYLFSLKGLTPPNPN